MSGMFQICQAGPDHRERVQALTISSFRLPFANLAPKKKAGWNVIYPNNG